MVGRNRPKEMRSIVKTLSKPRPSSPKDVDPEKVGLTVATSEQQSTKQSPTQSP